MRLITNSSPCCKSELDLFYSPPTNTSILSSSYVEAHPQTPLTGSEETFSIDIPGSDEYTDLNDIYLSLEVSLSKTDVTLENTSPIGPINNFAHSLFKRIDLSIGHNLTRTIVEIGNSNYSYKAYMLNLLNFGVEAKASWLQSGLYFKDDAGKFDSISLPTSTIVKKEGLTSDNNAAINQNYVLSDNSSCNQGYLDRRQSFLKGKGKVKMIIPIHCDLFQSNKFLISNMGMFFTFAKNSDDFLLMGEAGWNINIKKATVLARKCQINENIKLAHVQALQLSSLKYPIKQNRVLTHNISKGTKEYVFAGISTKIPNKIICGLLEDAAYNGSLTKNPFKFEDFGLISITLTVNDKLRFIKIDKANNDFVEGYHSLCECLNMYRSTGNSINKNDYEAGNCLFCFNLDADKGCEEQFNPLSEGTIGVTLNFKDDLKINLKLVIYMEYDNQLHINNKYKI